MKKVYPILSGWFQKLETPCHRYLMTLKPLYYWFDASEKVPALLLSRYTPPPSPCTGR